MSADASTSASAASAPVAADAAAAEHIPTADRLSLVSWGAGSAPSFPAIDDGQSETEGGDDESMKDVVKSTTTSVRSSVYDYVEENGRTYHRYKEGKYFFPNDAKEQERLDLQHAIFLLTTHGQAFLAPIKSPKRVLDVATGTGIWAIEFAQKFPDAEVVGTDLSPIQPDFIPTNCHFEIDDAEDNWTFAQPFDFIHGRALMSCFRDPAAVLRSAFAATAPGGYIELQDAVFPLQFASPPPAGSAVARWNALVVDSAAAAGRPWTNVVHYPRWLAEAGFADVAQRRFYWPFGTWARGPYYKMLGAYLLEDALRGIEGMSLKLLTRLGWSYADITALVADVHRELMDLRVNVYLEVVFVWARKPGGAAGEATEAAKADQTTPAV